MSRTVFYYKIWCTTDSQYEYVWLEDEPTVCPVNNTHTVDLNSISIENEVNTNEIKIQEESVPTGGNFMAECRTIICATGPGSVTEYEVIRPFPINALNITLVTTDENEGDECDLCVAPNTVIGVITANGATGATGINVNSTVIDNAMVGYYLNLTNGVDLHDCGRIIAINKEASSISWENALPYSFSAASPTYVRVTVFVVSNYTIGPANNYDIGANKIGGSYVPANTRILAKITNNSPYEKKLTAQFEYLY